MRHGGLVVMDGETEIVRLIYDLYLKGYGCRKIKAHLETNGIKTATGKRVWGTSMIDRILSNEKYIGTVSSQKTFVGSCPIHRQMQNTGRLLHYIIEDNHKAIIRQEFIAEVQRKKQGGPVE